MNDLRYAVRQLVRRPLFAGVVAVTLGLGIGASTGIFSIVRGLLLRPLPYRAPDELIMVFRTVPRLGFERSSASYPDYADWRAQATSVEEMGATQWRRAVLSGAGEPVNTLGARATASLWAVLGVPAAVGRTFGPDDAVSGAERVLVLSWETAQRVFGSATGAVGQSLVLDEDRYVVVGVMPREFYYPTPDAEYWEPLQIDPAAAERDANFLSVIARLAPGATVDDARTELTTLAARIDATAPDANRGYGLRVEARHGFVVRNVRTAVWVLFGAVTLLLAVACANVANLLLVRGEARRREFAVRTALGGSRAVILRGLVLEGLVLSLLAGAIGLLLAGLISDALLALAPDLPRAVDVQMDLAVFGFALLASVLTGVLFGLVPAARVLRQDVHATLKQSGGGATASGESRRLQSGLVVAQIGVAVALVVASSMLARHFLDLTGTAPGFRTDGLLTARIALPFDRYPEAPDREALFENAIARSTRLPGVTHTAATIALPFSGALFGRTFVVEGRPFPTAGEEPSADYSVVAGDYFQTMGIPLLRGRAFQAGDDGNAIPVAVINQRMAREYWPGEDPIGRRFKPGGVAEDNPWVTVIGVAGDVRRRALDEDVPAGWYRPFAQAAWPAEMFLVVRTDSPPVELAGALRGVLRELDPTLPVPAILTAAQRIGDSVNEPRMRTMILTAFAGLASLLAVLGIYSVMAFMVAQRSREIGIRAALGAGRQRIVGTILRSGTVLVATGAALGLVASAAASRVLRSLVTDVGPTDPAVVAAVAVLLSLCGVLGCYLPARRAARISPMAVLRDE